MGATPTARLARHASSRAMPAAARHRMSIASTWAKAHARPSTPTATTSSTAGRERGARDEDERPRGDGRREDVVDEAPPEREREEDWREERRVQGRAAEDAHEREDRAGHAREREGR